MEPVQLHNRRMANPFAMSKTFHRMGHATNTRAWRLLPTPRGCAVITTTGRKTGQPRVRAIRAIRDGDRLYAVALLGTRCDWLYNIRAEPRVRIKLGRRTYDATAREVTDGERAEALAAYLPNAGWFDYMDYVNFAWGVPTPGALHRAHEKWFAEGVPVVFELKATP
jgi:deazaflavin-dependent oxidoreductase (nitroreductase family)